MAKHDELFGENRDGQGRSDAKEKYANISASLSEFQYQVMRNAKSNGEAFLCGYTQCWVSEVFEGLPYQYEEYKNGKHGTKAGYKNYIGSDLIELFQRNKMSKCRMTVKRENF